MWVWRESTGKGRLNAVNIQIPRWCCQESLRNKQVSNFSINRWLWLPKRVIALGMILSYVVCPSKMWYHQWPYVCDPQLKSHVHCGNGRLLHFYVVGSSAKISHIIPGTFDVVEEYSVYWSLRQGATLEALNLAIPKTVININNKWEKEMPSKGSTISMPMIQRYADAEVCIPTLVQFSFLLLG